MKVEVMPDKNAIYFDWLDYVRESGQINMFGAPPLLAEAFGISNADARKIFIAWTKTFEDKDT